VGAKAGVEDGMTGRRRFGVAVARAGQPPAPDLDRPRGLADVHDAVALIVLRVARLEIGGAAGDVDVGAVHEPEMVDATGVRSGGVEERHGAGLAGVGDVEDLEAGRLQPDRLGLIGDDEQIAGKVERVRAHVAVGQIRLEDDGRLARIGDVDRGDVLRRRLVRQPEHAPAVARELDDHALADVAEPAEVVLREQRHVPGRGCGGHGRLRADRSTLPPSNAG
jgi:hypothetical protein